MADIVLAHSNEMLPLHVDVFKILKQRQVQIGFKMLLPTLMNKGSFVETFGDFLCLSFLIIILLSFCFSCSIK